MRTFLHGLALAAALGALVGCGTAPTHSRPPTSSSAPASSPHAAPPARLSVQQSSDIAIHALGLVGTPYRYGGNTPDTGFDCSGLIGYVYQSSTASAPPRTVARLNEWGQPIASDELRTGDLVVFGRGRPSHAGIYVGQGRFVHAPSTGGTVRLDRLDARHWAAQNVAFRRP